MGDNRNTFDDDLLDELDGIEFDDSDTIEADEFDDISDDSNDDIELDIDDLEDEQSDNANEATDYDGAIVSDVDFTSDDDDNDIITPNNSDFISDTGNIVVQDNLDGLGFELVYIDIENIAITRRIRKMESVEGLVQSIQSTGLLKPIVVAPTATEGIYVLIDGLRRIQACARAGKKKMPCIINNRINTPEIPVLEAMYNHAKKYNMREVIDYIDYLETQKGIMNPSMIEYLLQMESGDYTKLKDILTDDDEDIVTKLIDGVYDISTAFKKLEQRRKKESAEEKENKKAAKVYDDTEESGADQIEGSGEETDGESLTEEQIEALSINIENLDDDIENESISEMLEADKDLKGFKPHKQKTGEREYIDPIIKKTVMARDKSTCQCCKRGGEQYVDILDYHHMLPVFLGGNDTPENGVMLCVSCHRLVHLYSTDDLHIDKALLEGKYEDLTDEQKARYENEEIFDDEKRRFKRIIKLGSVIRQGIVAKGMNKEQYKKEHSNNGIGRRKPGVNAEQEIS